MWMGLILWWSLALLYEQLCQLSCKRRRNFNKTVCVIICDYLFNDTLSHKYFSKNLTNTTSHSLLHSVKYLLNSLNHIYDNTLLPVILLLKQNSESF